ncbi:MULTISPECIES: GIY-YIG nuclease family protein [Methylobacterium]|uniref:GIY-YIG nuclease family protein n=1 Tax=Methylobacterium thuringiense TaxID=1003091 RepID=A0ABQ4TKQ5_9HYPH|nr:MULTISPECIES: GIY-YIG nuclease family protein [Methylobacterium]TXN20624.1 GIY-YIG nuclease family protein [Methylobacterium sp. WL9]GJE55919.1 hypothetical protein EKPJFOCH_2416 [Methylobacterium thuringiense]
MFEAVGSIMPVWRLHRVDPGFVYVIENHGLYKIGKTCKSAARLKAAKTWLPDMKLIGLKPFWGLAHHERMLHTGFAQYWYALEWFDFQEDDAAREILLSGFAAFSDDNPDCNSVNFIYWFNGDGMAEIVMAQNEMRLSLSRFRKQESRSQKIES